jgi:hypothetical protein
VNIDAPLDLYSLFAALRQNRTKKISYWTFILFLRQKRKNKINVRRYFSVHRFDAKQQRVSIKPKST